jgi:processive 1,2-diacylglycerol beta-glucosyltransferase
VKPVNVLIVHASVGAGHTRAAQALASAFALEAPQVNVVVVDALDGARPLFRSVYADGYLELVERAPRAFGLLFDATDRPGGDRGLPSRLARAASDWGMKDFDAFLENGRWDAVASTHFLAAERISRLKARGRFAAPLTTVVTDFDAHALWAQPFCERYCVAAPGAKASLVACGVEPGAVAQTGIPIDPAFSVPVEREAAQRFFGLSGAYPVVVQCAGGRGIGPLDGVYRALLASTVPSEIVVVCGRNDAARRRLESIATPGRHRVKMLGFTSDMRRLLAAADVLVTKPGGLTVSEALACGLPMALVSPIPGQEERNADYLLENGAAVKASRPEYLTEKLEGILSSPQRLQALRTQTERLGRPRAAFAVARQVLEAAINTETTLSAATVAPRTSHWAIPGLQMRADVAAEAATAA